MPESRAVWRLHCSAEAIYSELPQSSCQCDQASTQKCGKGVFSNERPSVKLELVNIWNSKLQAQGDCTSLRGGESKEDSGTKWRDFRPEILQLSTLAISWMCDFFSIFLVKMMDFYHFQYEMPSGFGTENLKNLDTILDVTSGVLDFIGDSLVHDTIV